MASHTYTATVYPELSVGGNSIPLIVRVEFRRSPYDPGRTCGPPERCYPPEGGEIEDMRVVSLHLDAAEGALAIDCPDWLSTWIFENLDESELQDAADADDAVGPDPDDEREKRRDLLGA